jgi:hypothetical protein
MKSISVQCGCGCGELVTTRILFQSELASRGSIRYRPGHQNRGRKHTPEEIEKTRRPMALNGRWKGGRILDRDGYVRVKSPGHPYAAQGNYVFEHRLVMEKTLGRFLERCEIVHHINGVKNDNRPENLEVMVLGKHSFISNKGSKKPRANRAEFVCEGCGRTFHRSHWWHTQKVRFCSWECRYPKHR